MGDKKSLTVQELYEAQTSNLFEENERRAALARALVEVVIPLEVIAGQHRVKPYTELSPDLLEQVDQAIAIVRAALSWDSAPSLDADHG